jgi:hypothetical protein
MATRRHFLQGTLAGLGGTLALDGPSAELAARAGEPAVSVIGSGGATPDRTPPRTGSDVGSLYPFLRSQAVRGEFPLSYLWAELRDVSGWNLRARGKLLELLHYAPPACDPDPEVVERIEADGYVREKVLFHATPRCKRRPGTGSNDGSEVM